MKKNLCDLFVQIIHNKGYSFNQVVQITGMNKTQVNNVVNHSGKEVSLEKIMTAISEMGYTINISAEDSE